MWLFGCPSLLEIHHFVLGLGVVLRGCSDRLVGVGSVETLDNTISTRMQEERNGTSHLLTVIAVWNRHAMWLHIQGGPKKLAPFFLYTLTLPNINRFSKLFHCQNPEKIYNNTLAKDPTTPQVCRYTTLWNVSVIKATMKTRRLLWA